MDPAGFYEYELSAVEDSITKDYMGELISRREIKTELLRRPFWEQIPILRCSAHRTEQPAIAQPSSDIFRNFTASGFSYWSGKFWEVEWPDVSLLCRQALVVRGLRGPPFHGGVASPDPNQLDLRLLYNACGEKAWWWGIKMIDSAEERVIAPDLSELMNLGRPGPHLIGMESYWLDGVIQLQGKAIPKGLNYTAYKREVFPWTTAAIPIGRSIASASVLLGCVWQDSEGAEVGSLVWHYANGSVKKTLFIYGQTCRRFWKTQSDKYSSPTPAFQSKDAPEGETRVYSTVCENQMPSEIVTSLTLESNRESVAAPFILAITVRP